MKKYLFGILTVCLMCVSIESFANKITFSDVITTAYSDTKSLVDTLYHDGKDVVSTIYPDVKGAIVAIAKAIGVAAEHVYVVLVKNYVVLGVKELLVFLGAILLIVFGYIGWNKKTKEHISYKIIPNVLFMLVGIFLLFEVDYNAMLMGLVNPEWGAINYVLEYSKTLVK